MQYKYKLSEMSKTAPPEEAAKEFKEVADETNIPVVLSTVWKWRSQY